MKLEKDVSVSFLGRLLHVIVMSLNFILWAVVVSDRFVLFFKDFIYLSYKETLHSLVHSPDGGNGQG